MRHCPDGVVLAALIQSLPLRRIALLRPSLSQHCVDVNLQSLRILLCLRKLLGCISPGEPTNRGIQAGEVKACRSPIAVGTSPPFPAWEHPLLLVVLNLLPAMLADVDGLFGMPLWPAQLRELQRLEFPAYRTRQPIAALIALVISSFDATGPGDLGG